MSPYAEQLWGQIKSEVEAKKAMVQQLWENPNDKFASTKWVEPRKFKRRPIREQRLLTPTP